MNAVSVQERDRALAMVAQALESVPQVRLRPGNDEVPADVEIGRDGCPPLRIRLPPAARLGGQPTEFRDPRAAPPE